MPVLPPPTTSIHISRGQPSSVLHPDVEQLLSLHGIERDASTQRGRRRGNCLYVHRSSETVLPQASLETAKTFLPQGFVYVIVKYDRNINAFQFIASPDFDPADTPCLGDSCTIKRDGTICFRNGYQRVQLCHDKWLLVGDGYQGFDVAAAKRFSLRWRSVAGIDPHYVNYRDYWQRHVLPKIEAIP